MCVRGIYAASLSRMRSAIPAASDVALVQERPVAATAELGHQQGHRWIFTFLLLYRLGGYVRDAVGTRPINLEKNQIKSMA
jgi:hypothetical protein